MLKLKITQKDIEIIESELFIRGTVGAKCNINFDKMFWSNTANTIVFKRSGLAPINILTDSLDITVTIPFEILSGSGCFKVGVFGVAENIVTPTLWSDSIEIVHGTDTHGTEPTEYMPDEIDQLRQTKQDKLIAGDNVTIVDNVISATGGGSIAVDQTYNPSSENAQSGKAVASAVYQGTESLHRAVDYLQGDVSALEHLKQNKLTAGDNITIDENNVISAGVITQIWEECLNITTEETVSQVIVNFDKNYSEIRCLITFPADAKPTSGGMRFFFYDKDNGKWSDSKGAYVTEGMSNNNRVFLSAKITGNIATLDVNGITTDEGAKGQVYRAARISEDTQINSFATYAISVPAGTTFKAWGCVK